jgi:DNA-directed RNA polymerase specialized sigma24 family protein
MDRLTQDAAREAPVLTALAFNRLLEWLDDRVDSQGERYLEMRRRLVSYFDRRNRPAADDLADETLNRIGRTLEKDGVIGITPQARYCYTVARFVLLEDLRREHRQVRLDDEPRSRDVAIGAGALLERESLEIQEQRIECLERCLQALKPDQRALVIEYYRDAARQKIERRREMAKRLGITMNALAIRLSRIRAALAASVEATAHHHAAQPSSQRASGVSV